MVFTKINNRADVLCFDSAGIAYKAIPADGFVGSTISEIHVSYDNCTTWYTPYGSQRFGNIKHMVISDDGSIWLTTHGGSGPLNTAATVHRFFNGVLTNEHTSTDSVGYGNITGISHFNGFIYICCTGYTYQGEATGVFKRLYNGSWTYVSYEIGAASYNGIYAYDIDKFYLAKTTSLADYKDSVLYQYFNGSGTFSSTALSNITVANNKIYSILYEGQYTKLFSINTSTFIFIPIDANVSFSSLTTNPTKLNSLYYTIEGPWNAWGSIWSNYNTPLVNITNPNYRRLQR